MKYADEPDKETENLFINAFDTAKNQYGVRWNITMGLYWIRPYSYINLDDRNRQNLAMGKAFPPVDDMIASKLKSVPSGKEYLEVIGLCKKAMERSEIRDFVELSYRAWIETSSKNNEQDATYWPSLSEFNPGLTKDDWKNFLYEIEMKSHPAPMRMLRGLMEIGGEATCKKLASVYGGNPSGYVGCAVNLGKRVKKYFDLPPCMDGNQERFFPFPFFGRHVDGDDIGNYSYKIRPELLEALKEIDLSAFDPYKGGNDDVEVEDMSVTDVGLNTVLYGPPGTGKTYYTVIYAVAIIEKKELSAVESEDYEAVLKRYNEYKAQGHIEFTTFHQSYSYEEFIEGIKPVIADEGDDSVSNITYDIRSGVFKKFCENAETPKSPQTNDFGINQSPNVWKVSLEGTGDNPTRTECMNNNHIRIGYDEYGKDINDETDFSLHGGKNVLNAFIYKMQIGDIVLSCYSASTIDAIGVVTGEYEWHNEYNDYKRLRKVNWIVKGINENILSLNGGHAMTLASTYKMNVSLFDVYSLIEKHNRHVGSIENNDNYVFIIDEINRGNISKIFGELIALIETPKRTGNEEGMKAILPYSQKPFGVPKNVYIIGTMNTADRSIATIDTALRRRFLFREMMPNTDVLSEIFVENVSVKNMLEKINRRISVLYDREHTIGHAYFVPLKMDPTVEKLAEIFMDNIIPLLQEYFYDDYERIRLVLGDNQKTSMDEQFITVTENDYAELFGDADVGIDIGCSYEINKNAFYNINAYAHI